MHINNQHQVINRFKALLEVKEYLLISGLETLPVTTEIRNTCNNACKKQLGPGGRPIQFNVLRKISREYKYKCELIMLGKAMDLPQFYVFHFQLEKCALF